MTTPGGRASAGSVGVDVRPQARGFFREFRAQTQSDAVRAGQEIGRTISQQITQRIGDALSEGVTRGGRNARSAATAAGNNIGSSISGRLISTISRAVGEGVTDGGRTGVTRGAGAGASIGRALAAAIVRQVRESITEGVDRGGREAAPRGTRDGSEYGGRFGSAVHRRLEAALRALPKATIDGDTDPAQHRIQELRAEILALRDARIGVDIDEAAALAKLAALQAELERIGRTSESVRVRVDAGGAAAEIAALRAQLSQIEQDSARVGAASEGSSGSVRGLTAAFVGLGPAALPVLAALAGGAAAVGLGIAAGVVGVGALALGVVGIGTAVKALSAAEDDAQKSSVSYGASQAQVASAADAVRNAEQSLSQARENAADAEIRAAQNVRGAEQQLATAQRQARDAQEALTRARDDAVRTLEDLDSQVKDNALAERQAILDRTRAYNELQRVQLNPVATDFQREQAQIAFEESEQHLRELGIQQRRLTTEQSEATKRGVEGSLQVTAAQRQVEDASRGVADAQQRVADAAREQASQQRQSAVAIAQAQQGVVAAQRQMQQATLAATTAGGAAADTLRKALDNLSPSGQRFAQFLYSLKPILDSLRGTAQDGILPGAETGMRRLLPLVPEVNVLLRDTSETIGQILARSGNELNAPVWRRFLAFLRSETGPALTDMSDVVFNIGRGVTGLGLAFAPVERVFSTGLVRLARDFRDFGENANSNSGVRGFVTYVLDKGPELVRTGLTIASALLHIAQAGAPIGSVLLVGIRLLANVIEAIPVPVLTGMLAVILPLVAAIKVWTVVSSAFAAVQLFVGQVTDFARAAVSRFSGEVVVAGTRSAAAGAGVATFAAGIGGPLTLALVAATVLIGVFAAQASEQTAKVDGLKDSLLGLADSYGESADASSGLLKNLVANDENFRNMIRDSQELGIGIDTVSEAVRGNKGALDSVTSTYDEQITMLTRVKEALKAGATGSNEFAGATVINAQIQAQYGKTAADRLRDLQAQRDAIIKAAGSTRDQAAALAVINGAQERAAGTGKTLTVAEEGLYTALEKAKVGAGGAAAAAGELRRQYELLNGPAQNQDQAAERFAAALDRVRDAVKKGETALGNNTAAARTNKDNLRDLIKASVELYEKDIAAGVSIADATKAHQGRIAALGDEAKAGHFAADQVDDLIRLYGHVPSVVETELRLLGYADADAKLSAIGERAKQLAEKYGLDVKTAARLATSGVGNKLDRLEKELPLAEGGHVRGPGTDTSDSIPARLSDYEYVQPAAAVRHYGVDFMEAVRTRSLPKFAAGGLVGRPELSLTVDSDLTKWPTFQLYTLAAEQAMRTLENLGTLANTGLYKGADPTGSVGAILGLARIFDRGAQVSSGFRSGSTSLSGNADYHSQGLAADLVSSNGNAGMLAIAKGFYGISGRLLEELHSQSPGYFVKNGQRVGPNYYGAEVAGHFDHVHVAARRRDLLGFDAGGYLPPGISTVFNGIGRPEPVLTPDQMSLLAKPGQGGGMTLRVVVDDGEIAGLVRVEVDDAFGVLADAQVYGVS